MRTMNLQLGQRLAVLGAKSPARLEILSAAIVMTSLVKAGTPLEEAPCPSTASQSYSVKTLAVLWTVLASTILPNALFCPVPITNNQLDHGRRSKTKTFLLQIWYDCSFLKHGLSLGSQRIMFILQAVPRLASSV